MLLLEDDIREDNCQPLIDAILMLKGVIKVEGWVADIPKWAAYEKARNDLQNKLWEVLK